MTTEQAQEIIKTLLSAMKAERQSRVNVHKENYEDAKKRLIEIEDLAINIEKFMFETPQKGT